MIKSLGIELDESLFARAISSLAVPTMDFRLTINKPSGHFFYDPWVISDEYKGTVWEEVLNTLPFPIGEARLIKLTKGNCYIEHADIDDRWHLSIISGKGYLVDLEAERLHRLRIGQWYEMNAGKLHSAVNFGGDDRVQLVVRQLLTRNNLLNPKRITIKPTVEKVNSRYTFDKIYSPLLNLLNKTGLMTEFKIEGNSVSFLLESHIELPQHEDFDLIVDRL